MTVATRRLSSSPNMLAMFARAGAAALPAASRLPFLAGGGRAVPDVTLELDEVTVDRDRLASYARVCAFTLSDTLPPTYPHMLVFPLHLALMTDSSFPVAPIGLVHIANRITQHRPIDADEKLSLKVRATEFEPHPRGRQFSLISEVRAGGELVWEEASTNLRRGHGTENAKTDRLPATDDLPATATWQLKGDLGRRYGAVSGDLNPIHIHPLTARLFGFPSAIAHGMWTKARCLAALQPRLPDAFTATAAFRKPIILPATVEFAHRGERFGVRDAHNGTPHLDGTLSEI